MREDSIMGLSDKLPKMPGLADTIGDAAAAKAKAELERIKAEHDAATADQGRIRENQGPREPGPHEGGGVEKSDDE
jgi:hypothetical protein